MKLNGDPHYPAKFPVPKTLNPSSVPDLKSTRRRSRNPSLPRVRKPGAQAQRRSRPETPLLKWKVEDREEQKSFGGRRGGGGGCGGSAEEPPEASAGPGFGQEACCWTVAIAGAGQCRRWRRREFGSVRVSGEVKSRYFVLCFFWVSRSDFESAAGHVDMGVPFHVRCNGKAFGSEPKDPLQSPGSSVSGMKSGFLCKGLRYGGPDMEIYMKG